MGEAWPRSTVLVHGDWVADEAVEAGKIHRVYVLCPPLILDLGGVWTNLDGTPPAAFLTAPLLLLVPGLSCCW